jgi:phosphoribosyl 1,2-cyclic phosphodiesterase
LIFHHCRSSLPKVTNEILSYNQCITMKFNMLGSGSTGNCGLIRTKSSIVLVDVGFSCKRIKEILTTYNICSEQIGAVFISHEHFDHIQGLRSLSKFRHIKLLLIKILPMP